MAVEIPVYVDIQGAFKRAAQDVPDAMKSFQSAVDKNQIDLFPHIEKSLENVKAARTAINELSTALKGLMSAKEASFFAPFDPEKAERVTLALMKAQVALNGNFGISQFVDGLTRADFELLQMREHYTALEESSRRMSTSINGYRERLQNLNEQWNNLTASEKFASNGKMTAEAQRLYNEFKKETNELREQGKTLDQLLSKEERRAQKHRDIIANRKKESAILGATTKSLSVLQAQEHLLWGKLQKAEVGSTKYEKLKQQLIDVRKELDRLNGKVMSDLGQETEKANNKLASLIKNSIRLVALHAGASFIRNVREVTAEFELQRVALGSIIQDTERAESLFKQIKAAAIESPFEIKDLVSYTKQLSAYQIETDKLFDTTMKLADVSAGLGVDMGRLILAYGQVRAAAVLRGQELRQFTEAGIPLVDKLAKKFSDLRGEMVSTGEVFQLISERAVPFRMIEEIFDDMTSAGGEFYKMQEKQAKTLAGQWANLKDSISIMYDEIGNTSGVHRAMEELIQDARWLMQNWRSLAQSISVVGSTLIAYVGYTKAAEAWTKLVAKAELMAKAAESSREVGMKKLVTSIIGKTAAEKISTIATNLHTAAIGKANAVTSTFAKTFWNLTAAMLNNPFGIVAVAVAGLIALFTTLNKKTRDVSKDVDSTNASIAAFNKTTGETAKMIDQYDELSKKEKLTAEEAAKLRDISRELGNVFPKTTEGINEQTGALILNVEKLKEYNKEAEEAIRKGLKAQLENQKKEIRKNQKEIDRLTKETNRGWGRNKNLSLLSPILFPLSSKRMEENKDRIIELTDKNNEYAKSNQEIEDTLNGVTKKTEDAIVKTSKWQDVLIEFNSRVGADGKVISVIDPDQVKNYSKLSDALEDISKKYKDYAEQEKSVKAALKGKTGAEREELEGILERTSARKRLAKEELDYYNAFYLTQKKGGSTDRLKALKEEIKDITDAHKKYIELRKYESEEKSLSDVSLFFPSLKGWKPTYDNMVSTLEKLLTQYKGDADATRIIEQAIANIKFDEIKRSLDEKLKRLSEEIKRSEVARDFYKNILDLTGDNDLAATLTMSVYGQPGEEFKDRIQKELIESLNSIDPALIDKGLLSQLIGDATILDFDDLYANINSLPQEVQAVIRRLRGEVEKYNAETAKNYTKLLLKSDETKQQEINITKQAAKDIADIESGLALEIEGIRKKYTDPKEQEKLIKQATERSDAAKGAVDRQSKIELERLKKNYRLFFSSVGVISEKAARSVVETQKKMLTDQFVRGEISFSRYSREIDELDKQLQKYASDNGVMWAFWKDGIEGALDKTKEYSSSLLALASTIKVGDKGVWTPDDDEKNFLKRIDEVLNFGAFSKIFSKEKIATIEVKINAASQKAYNKAIKEGKSEAQAMEEASRAAGEVAAKTGNEMSATASKFAASMAKFEQVFYTVGSWISFIGDELERTRKEGGQVEDWGYSLVNLNEGILGAYEKLKSGDVFGGMISLGRGIQQMIHPIQPINNAIEDQGKLLEDLEYQYSRLDEAIAKSFGADYIYNYNKQMETLAAQAEAYRKQAELERSKGKMADENTARDYEQSARDIEDQIADMRSQLSEFFSGTDLTSAAEDFANAWIEAYKEFGSTTDAMSEKFNDMIQNMINRSLAAKIMQEMLQPIFDQIDTMAGDGLLATEEIAAIAALAQERITLINDAMTNLMTSLASAGLDVRASTAGFHGISKDIAGASEESILGLAAAINTQNFYISYVPTISENVSQILAAMTGGVSPTAPVETNEAGEVLPSVQRMVYDHLPNMDANLSEMLRLFRSVITTKTGSTNTNYVAIK